MQATIHPHSSLAHRLRGGVLVLAGAALFLGVASVIKPPPRSATAMPPSVSPYDNALAADMQSAFTSPVDINSTNPNEAALVARLKARATQTEATHPKGWKLIGTLEGTQHLLRCWATPDGPRYSVYTLEGRLIQADLPADEVYRGFPDVELDNLRADPPQGNVQTVDFVDVWRD